jgi:hypothetical protein
MTNDDMRDDANDEPMGAEEVRLQAALEREARAYNAPPATAPRDAMWGEIRARLDAGRTAPRATTVTPIALAPSRRGWTRHAAWGAIAAGALIAGVGLGRLTTPATVASPAVTPTVESPAQPLVASTATEGPSATAPAVATPGVEPARADSRAASGATRLASTAPSPRDRDADGERGEGAPAAYRNAATVHLAAAEALLVSLRAPGDRAAGDTAVAAWAGDLLGTTRVLLDSPAARDRRTRRLLEDLELVLAQIARLRPDAPADGRGVSDRDLIDQAIRQRQMLTRLRAAGA